MVLFLKAEIEMCRYPMVQHIYETDNFLHMEDEQ